MIATPARPPSFEPDLSVLQRLSDFERHGLLVVRLLAGLTLLLWLSEVLHPWLPDALRAMKLNTAIAMLLLDYALRHSAAQAKLHELRTARAAATIVLLIAGFTLLEYVAGVSLRLDNLFVQDRSEPLPGRMSWQTAIGLGLVVLCMLTQRMTGAAGAAADLLMLALIGFALMSVSGAILNLTGWFEGSRHRLTSPQALICFVLLAVVITARRAQYGVSAVLVGIGIGSRVARLVLPYALALPFVFVLLRHLFAEQGYISETYAIAVSVTLQALLFLGVVIWMATRINRLESELRHMSLVDELTQVNNRRGFMLLADQALRVARREQLPATLFFFDLDGLKKINDTLGHDAGSDFIRSVAQLLKRSFREGDVVARIGGDEFVVLAIDHERPGEVTLRRIEATADAKAKSEGLPYALAFSAGHADVDFGAANALEQALQLADQRMYAIKTARKATRS